MGGGEVILFRAVLAATRSAILTIGLSSPARAEERTTTFGRCGIVHLYYESPRPTRVVLFVSGDGGWGVTDKGLSAELAKQGIPVVVLNSLKYFWTRRTPASASRDLARIMNRYTRVWGRRRAILVGYSLGADVLPFMYNRPPADLQGKVAAVVLLGPSPTVEFEFHVTDWLGKSPARNALPVLPEVGKIAKAEIICFYGEEDRNNICREIDPKIVHVRVISLPTGHRFGRDFEPIARAILSGLKKNDASLGPVSG
jgi:type IV secretory pathway VirJ component